MSLTRELPRYQGAAGTVHALKIESLLENPRGIELHFEDKGFCPMQFPALWIETRQVEAGGYFVWDRYGDKSFVPGAEFEAAYTLIGGGDA